MVLARDDKTYTSLEKGLITESSPLGAPEGFTIDESNFIFDMNGRKRIRRRGLDSELRNLIADIDITNFYAFYWEDFDSMLVVYSGIDGEERVTKIVAYSATTYTQTESLTLPSKYYSESYVYLDHAITKDAVVLTYSDGKAPIVIKASRFNTTSGNVSAGSGSVELPEINYAIVIDSISDYEQLLTSGIEIGKTLNCQFVLADTSVVNTSFHCSALSVDEVLGIGLIGGESLDGTIVSSAFTSITMTPSFGVSEFSYSDLVIQTRDFDVQTSAYGVSIRPFAITSTDDIQEHVYNLLNSGWYREIKKEGADTLYDPLEVFQDANIDSVFSTDVDTLLVESGTAISLWIRGAVAEAFSQLSNVVETSMKFTLDGVDYTGIRTNSSYGSGGYWMRISNIAPELPADPISTQNTITWTFDGTLYNTYPALNDVLSTAISAEVDGSGNDVREYFKPQLLNEKFVGATPAPAGHYVFSVGNIDRESRIKGSQNDGVVTSTTRIL